MTAQNERAEAASVALARDNCDTSFNAVADCSHDARPDADQRPEPAMTFRQKIGSASGTVAFARIQARDGVQSFRESDHPVVGDIDGIKVVREKIARTLWRSRAAA